MPEGQAGGDRRASRSAAWQRGTRDKRPVRAILDATEKLLATTPLSDLTVADILGEAGVARGSFYFYFDSKHAVVAALLAGFLDEVLDTVKVGFGDPEAPPAIREVMVAVVAAYRTHEPAVRAAAEHWRAHAEIESVYLGMCTQIVDLVAAAIDRAVEAGTTSVAADARGLAAALTWMNERCLYMMAVGAEPAFATDDQLVDALTAVWRAVLPGSTA